jgi:hypothetical protein
MHIERDARIARTTECGRHIVLRVRPAAKALFGLGS